MIQTIFIIAAFILIVIIACYWVYSIYAGAPFYPSNKNAVKTITDFVLQQPNLKYAIELGSGDGRITNTLAKQGLKMTAVEINPALTLVHRLNKILGRIENVEIKQQNFMKLNMAKYDVVIVYLFPEIMVKLEQKLYKELKPGSFVITNTFQFKNKKPFKKLDHKIVVYKI